MLGVICGLEMEARIARKFAGDNVAVSAVKANVARERTAELINNGATQIMSFGLAGGLAPDLCSGDIVIGTHVATKDKVYKCDDGLIDHLIGILGSVRCGAVWGSEGILAKAADKQALYKSSSCLIADMESYHVGEVAALHKVPFAIVRAVVDVASFNIPPASLVPIKDDGRTDLVGVAGSIIRNPLQVLHLVDLGASAFKATRSLEIIAAKLVGKSA